MAASDAPRRETYYASLGAEAVAASTPYVLVDLSDTTNFPHNDANFLNLLGLVLHTEKASDGVYDIWVGVVIENDATDGSAKWFHVFHLEHVDNTTDSTDRFAQTIDFTLGGANPDGVNCKIASGAATYIVTNQQQAANGNWQNDTNRASPVGSTTKPGVGDVVVWVEEVSGTGTLDFVLSAIYEAH
jgi:hypothetical protein